jgi:hypothetical protein
MFRLAFHQFRSVFSSVRAVRVKLNCDKLLAGSTYTIEDEFLTAHNAQTHAKFVQSFSPAYQPRLEGLAASNTKFQAYSESYVHPLLADKNWVHSPLSQNLGRIYSYSLWFKADIGTAKACFFEISSLASDQRSVHTVYTNTFNFVRSLPASVRLALNNNGAGNAAAAGNAEAGTSGFAAGTLPPSHPNTPVNSHCELQQQQVFASVVTAETHQTNYHPIMEDVGDEIGAENETDELQEAHNQNGGGLVGFLAKNFITLSVAAVCVAAKVVSGALGHPNGNISSSSSSGGR